MTPAKRLSAEHGCAAGTSSYRVCLWTFTPCGQATAISRFAPAYLGLNHLSPALLHQLAGDRVQTLLEASAPPGLLAMTAVGVRLTDAGVIPDVVVARESAVLAGGALLSASDVRLVVEIVSPSTRMMDRRIKPEIYAAAGIANFWRLEPRPFRGQLKTERLPVLLAYSLNAESAYEVIQRVDASEPATLKHPFPVDIDLAGLLPTNAIDG